MSDRAYPALLGGCAVIGPYAGDRRLPPYLRRSGFAQAGLKLFHTTVSSVLIGTGFF